MQPALSLPPPARGRADASRSATAEAGSIGRGSRALKRRHLIGRIWRTLLGVAVVVAVAMALGWVIGGIGFSGLLLTATTALLAAAYLLCYPRLTVPHRQDLALGPLPAVIARTELWLESRQAGLPRAARLIEHLAFRLDSIGMQLDRVDEHPGAAADLRWLIGEHVPALIRALERVRGDESASEVAIAGLVSASADLERISRQLASGTFDDLPLKARRVDSLPWASSS